MAVPKKKTSKAKSRSRRAVRLEARRARPQQLPPLRRHQAAPRGVRQLRLVPRPPGHRRRLTPSVLPIAVDAMGGDKAPAEIVAGAKEAAATLGVAGAARRSTRRDRRSRRPRGHRRLRGDRHGRRCRRQRAAHEGLVAGAGGRGGPRRTGLGHGERRQHRGHHGQRPAAHGAHQGRGPTGHRHADPGARRHAHGHARRRCQRRVQRRVARAVRPDGRRLRPRPLRHRAPAGGAPVDRRGGDQGQPAGQGDPQAAGRPELDRHAPVRSSSATSRAATS